MWVRSADNWDVVAFYTECDAVSPTQLCSCFLGGEERGELFLFFWQKLAHSIEAGPENDTSHCFCALVKRGEWKRAENSHLLLCFKYEMKRGEQETEIWNLCARWSEGKHHSWLSVLENRGEIICCLCWVFCLCLPARFPTIPWENRYSKVQTCLQLISSLNKAIVFMALCKWDSTLLYTCVYVNAIWSKWSILYLSYSVCCTHPKVYSCLLKTLMFIHVSQIYCLISSDCCTVVFSNQDWI